MGKKAGNRGVDPRIAQRREEVARRRRKRARRPLLIVAVVATAGVVAYSAATSEPLRVKRVEVEGVRRVPVERVEDASGVLGAPIFLVDESAVADRVEKIPQIEEASVRRELFSRKVLIVVVERRPVAAISSGSVWLLLDAEGVPVDETDTQPPALSTTGGMVSITGMAEPSRTAGKDERLAGVIHAAEELSRWTSIPISWAGSNERGIYLELSDGSRVIVGRSEELEAKGRALRALQAQAKAEWWSVSVYEVSTPKSPAVLRS